MTKQTRTFLVLTLLLVGCQAGPRTGAKPIAVGAPAPLADTGLMGMARADGPPPVVVPPAAAIAGADPVLFDRQTPPPAIAEETRVVPGRLVVSLAAGISPEAFMARPEAIGLSLVRTVTLSSRHHLSIQLPAALDAAVIRAQLSALPEVLRILPETIFRGHAIVPKDPKYGDQWGHTPAFANTEAAWGAMVGVDQSKVIVAMIDTGIDTTHEDLVGRFEQGFNINDKGPNVVDDVGHGTVTAGILGANGDNLVGGAGVAWGVRILPIKASKDNLNEFESTGVLAGLQHAIEYNGKHPGNVPKVRVINMSLGENHGGVTALYVDAVSAAKRAGILIVSSSGNAGADIVGSPANTPGVIAVGATGHYMGFEFLAHFSNYGKRLDMVAPGVGVQTTIPMGVSQVGNLAIPPTSKYAYVDGTSEAAPFVAGVAALCAVKFDKDNASLATEASAIAFIDKLRGHLLASCDDLGAPKFDPSFGWGRINAGKAVTAATMANSPQTF